jgi:hypothetical protein
MSKKEDDTTPLEKFIGAVIILVIVFFVYRCKWSDNDNDSKYDKKIAKTEKVAGFVGTYTTTDAVGTKLTFILSEDGTVKCHEEYKTVYGVANSYSKNNEYGKYKQTATKTHYGSWEKISNTGSCEITITHGPIIYFDANNNNEPAFRYQIKNGYLYTNYHDYKASNPNRRLKITKQ